MDESRESCFREIGEHIGVKGIYEITKKLSAMGFFTAPASTKYHGAYEGGLFGHCYQVYANLINVTMRMGLQWQDKHSVFKIAFFHDLCKCDCYKKDGDGYLFVKDTLLTGHGMKSLILAQEIMPITEEEKACIVYHMGAFTEKEEWSSYTNAIHKYPNVLWTHQADMLAAHVDNI